MISTMDENNEVAGGELMCLFMQDEPTQDGAGQCGRLSFGAGEVGGGKFEFVVVVLDSNSIGYWHSTDDAFHVGISTIVSLSDRLFPFEW